jgi:hypothetical protein
MAEGRLAYRANERENARANVPGSEPETSSQERANDELRNDADATPNQ